MELAIENEVAVDEVTAITFLNGSGDITITWDAKHDEKMKELIRKKMKEGYSFFTTRHVPLTHIPYKRQLGQKGVETMKDLIIKDKDFEKIVKMMDDADIARQVDEGHAGIAKRQGESKKLDTGRRVKDADEVKKGDRLLGMRPIAGG